MELPARQQLAGGAAAPRHRHDEAYAAIVLVGGYVEAGDRGRRTVGPGDVILHDAFEAHANRFDARGATVLNLSLPAATSAQAFMRIGDPDAIVRLAERDPRAAAQALHDQLAPAPPTPSDWRDLLAEALRSTRRFSLGQWAREAGLDAATVSRGFRAAYGATPSRYRAEIRAHAAWRRLGDAGSLAELALDAGFADQAHMTRAILALTGRPPGAWRRSNRFKIGASAAA